MTTTPIPSARDYEMGGNDDFVFIDDKNDPYYVRMWGTPARAWLFYWHPDKKWVSLRKLGQMEIWQMAAKALRPEQAKLYHDLAEKHSPTTPASAPSAAQPAE
jgi:hypothetical protein